MTTDNDLLFEFDPLDINASADANTDTGAGVVSLAAREGNPVLLKVTEHVKASWQACQANGASTDIHRAVANILSAKYGYNVVVRCTQGAYKAPEFLKQLRHQFLVLVNVPGVQGQEILVDWNFVDNFVLARITPRFASILAQLPPFYVGTADDLRELVSAVAAEMKLVCREHTMPLPPWRQEDSLLSKWLSPAATDLVRFYGAGVLGESPTSVLAWTSPASSVSPSDALPLRYDVATARMPLPGAWNPQKVVTGFAGTTITSARPFKKNLNQLEALLGPLCTVKLAG